MTILPVQRYAASERSYADVQSPVVPGDRTTGNGSPPISQVIDAYENAVRELEALKHDRKRVARKLRAESELRPWQVELLKLQMHLEAHRMRMIVLFEGRDAAGKGGTIRRVTRYMNEKHYRVVALGKPTEDQRSQWYFQRYVAQLPAGGEIVLFDRSWYNRAMVEPVFGFCTDEEYQHFMLGVTGFEKDLVRQGTVLVKLYFSVTKEEQRRRFAAPAHRPAAAVEVQRDRHAGSRPLGRVHHSQVRDDQENQHPERALGDHPFRRQAAGPAECDQGHAQRGGLQGPQQRPRLRTRRQGRALRDRRSR